jgi:hypothetical protein
MRARAGHEPGGGASTGQGGKWRRGGERNGGDVATGTTATCGENMRQLQIDMGRNNPAVIFGID